MRMPKAIGCVSALASMAMAGPIAAQVASLPAEGEAARTVRSGIQRPTTSWQIATGLTYSEGDYGQTSRTDSVSVPISLRLRYGDWFARAAISGVSIKGAAAIIDTGPDGTPESDGQGVPAGTAMQTRSGLGDLSLTGGRRFNLSDTTQLVADVQLKLPTASEARRLTTGTTDVTLRARLSQDFGPLTLRAGARRRLAGGDGRVIVRDTWGVTGGASLDMGHGLAIGADYNWLQSSFANHGPNSTATAYVSAPFRRNLRITGFGSAGLSSNSADFTMGTSITWRIG